MFVQVSTAVKGDALKFVVTEFDISFQLPLKKNTKFEINTFMDFYDEFIRLRISLQASRPINVRKREEKEKRTFKERLMSIETKEL